MKSTLRVGRWGKDAAKSSETQMINTVQLLENTLDLRIGSQSDHLRDVPTSPQFRSALRRAVSWRYWRRLPSPPGRILKDSPIAITGVPGDFVSQDDERLFAFVNALRISIKEKVAAEQLRGTQLSEIVIAVREMAQLAEQKAPRPKPFSEHAFRAIARQAVAWCIEAYQPSVLVDEQDLPRDLNKLALPVVLALADAACDQSPAKST